MERRAFSQTVWFLDVRESDFSPEDTGWQTKINRKMKEIFDRITTLHWEEPVLIKCHIGEPRCSTRMLPEYCLSSVEHARNKGFHRICCGDSTVVYSGERGRRENPIGSPGKYLNLARSHGWTEEGPLATPFVILDRPDTSVRGVFEFGEEEVQLRTDPFNRFKEVFAAGGFHSAGTIINHVHLTLHDLAHTACAVKGLAMGGASSRGKLMMHQHYTPLVDSEECILCGVCAEHCPEEALKQSGENMPRLDESDCIGCGECVAVCSTGALVMTSQEIYDWDRGRITLPFRMADYLVGLMENRWDRLLNVVHMYNVTRRCDCVDEPQEPMMDHMGFLIGTNPFVVDIMARNLMRDEFQKPAVQRDSLDATFFFENDPGIAPYDHVKETFHIPMDVKCIRIDMASRSSSKTPCYT
ncbi:MAG: DUF362 domain-containing protein [Thermodesulfobacteriota bacterium]|nr:DUF362 domain-containing protein [Thermodesulfobacteriota bacterium]